MKNLCEVKCFSFLLLFISLNAQSKTANLNIEKYHLDTSNYAYQVKALRYYKSHSDDYGFWCVGAIHPYPYATTDTWRYVQSNINIEYYATAYGCAVWDSKQPFNVYIVQDHVRQKYKIATFVWIKPIGANPRIKIVFDPYGVIHPASKFGENGTLEIGSKK